MDIKKILVKADKICNYIPIVSNICSLVDLYLKHVYIPKIDKNLDRADAYFQHLADKSTRRCVILAACPLISNLFFGIYDWIHRESRREKAELLKQLRSNYYEFKSNVLEKAPKKYRNDPDFMLKAIDVSSEAVKYASEALKKNQSFALDAIKIYSPARRRMVLGGAGGVSFGPNRPPILKYLSPELQMDRKVVLASVKKDGRALQHACESFRNDKEIVLTALRYYGNALQYASEALQDDKEVVLVAVREEGWALQFASERLQNDKEVVLAAIKKYAEALEFAGKELQDDKEVVLYAVRKFAWPLRFASERLRNDKEVVLAAIKRNARAIQYASEALQKDVDVIHAASNV